MSIKRFLKKSIPTRFLSSYRNYATMGFRMKILEDQSKNQWLLDRKKQLSQKELFRMKEFKVFSQTGEDGIIDYIFQKISIKNKTFVEIGIEDGKECNTANLSMNFGWKGVVVEGDSKYAQKAVEYYQGKPLKVINSFVTKENINQLLKDNGLSGKIDLLSIDIDGNDYWIWKEINVIDPRVVVIEYNPVFGYNPVTIKYSQAFERFKSHKSGLYYGSSITALNKLAESKGYNLVCCGSFGFNAFFVKKSECKSFLKKLSPEEAHYPLPENQRLSKFENIKNLSFEEIK